MTRQSTHKANNKVTVTAMLITAILIVIYILGQFVYTSFDATEERKYTLAPATKTLIRDLDEKVYIRVLLDGRFPAGFQKLQDATQDILRRFSQLNPNIEYNFENPNEGSVEEINARRKQLAGQGIIPTQLRVTDAAGASSQYIYPFAVIHYGSRSIPVYLLQDDIPGADKDSIIFNSIGLLEYKIADGIQKIQRTHQEIIAFSSGQGELSDLQTASIQNELRNSYAIYRLNLDSIVQIPLDIKILIVAKPTQPFTDAQLFMLDQYVMHGGRIMFFIDPLFVSLDSINIQRNYIPIPYEHGLDALFFKWGARLNPDLVLDLQSTRIPMVVGMQGERPQTELYPWFYHPLISSTSEHPVTKGLDRIQLEFPGSIDTIQTATNIRKTILMRSSKYSRIQLTPVRLNFNILREQPDPQLFNKGEQTLAVMLEGRFESIFQNRLSAQQLETLEAAGVSYKSSGEDARVLIVSDGDMIKNLVNPATEEIAPLGYNKYENTTFTGNRDFILNAIEYMLDESGVLEARSKDIRLRLLNTVKAREEAVKWQLINILIPLFIIFITGVIYYFIRKRKFGYVA